MLSSGVWIAAALCAAGLIWRWAGGHEEPAGNTAGEIVKNSAAGRPLAVAQAGLLVLVLTPAARVAVLMVGMWMNRSRAIATIAMCTFVVLVCGMWKVLLSGW